MTYKELLMKAHKVRGVYKQTTTEAVSFYDTRIKLIINYKYLNSERDREFFYCLDKNLSNPMISRVVVFLSENHELIEFNHPKLTKVFIGRRMTFFDAFEYANKSFDLGYWAIANSDIYFDDSLVKVHHLFNFYERNDLFLAITRHNVFKDGRKQLGICGKYGYLEKGRVGQVKFDEDGGYHDWGSQDAWIFKVPVKKFLVNNSNFEIGRINCDGHLAWLANLRGYKVLNPCYEIIASHVHDVEPFMPYEKYEHLLKMRVNGPNLMLNPDGSNSRSPKTFIQGSNSNGKVKMYAMYTDSHEVFVKRYFLPSIKDDYFLVLKKFSQLCETGTFESAGWIEAIIDKTRFIIDAIKENMGSYFVFSDVDIQFFEKSRDKLEELIKDKDIVFQQDTKNNFENNKSPMPCTGFFVCRANKETLKLWSDVLEYVEETNINEQATIARLIDSGRYKVKIGFLPNIFWGPGKEYGIPGFHWRPGMELDFPEELVLHHANWTYGIHNKLKQLEYIKDKVFKLKGYC